MIIDDTLGERIRFYRHRAGLTKADLAKMTGISTSTLSKYEQDMIECPDVEILVNLSLIFNITVNRLIMGLEDPAKHIPREPLLGKESN